MDIYALIDASVKQNASDLHLSAGNLPMLRINGELLPYGETTLDAEVLEQQLTALLSNEQQNKLNSDKQLDFSLTMNGDVRVRGNIFYQRLGISAVFRHIPLTIPTLQSLAPPDILHSLAELENGLVLVTGATGSGKSTTLAALIQQINNTQQRHIITLEDPIEFIHYSRHSLIQQREIGEHLSGFASGLHAALREDPDIILLGELRDPETIALALTAAETGHLVLASLHTRSAIQSIERIIDVFSAEDKPFIRQQLANGLKAVITQKLLKSDTGRIAAFEVLVNTVAVSNLIREGKTHQIYSIQQTGQNVGMQTMEQAIRQRIHQQVLNVNPV